jgi:hypothetical protein
MVLGFLARRSLTAGPWRSVQTKGRAALDELGKNCASGVDILLG